MDIKDFLEKNIEGYLLCDLENMAKTMPATGKLYGACSYPMIMATLSGVELLGSLTRLKPYDAYDGRTDFKTYWTSFIAQTNSGYSIFADFFYNMIRHGLMHSFLTKSNIVVDKGNITNHLTYDATSKNLIIDPLSLYKDFETAYLRYIKPIAFKGTSFGSITDTSMQSRLDEIENFYNNDSISNFQKIQNALKISPTKPAMSSRASTSTGLSTSSSTPITPSGIFVGTTPFSNP